MRFLPILSMTFIIINYGCEKNPFSNFKVIEHQREIALPSDHPCFECGMQMIDTRDGQHYNTIWIDDDCGNDPDKPGTCWMTENLNIGELKDNTNNLENDGIIQKLCYEGDCSNFGGYYTWMEAMDHSPNFTQGICPEGWHLPTEIEFKTLVSLAQNNPDNIVRNSSDKFGFSADLTGFISVSSAEYSFQRGSTGFYWSSTNSDPLPYILWINYICPDSIFLVNNTPTNCSELTREWHAVCVRCVKDN